MDIIKTLQRCWNSNPARSGRLLAVLLLLVAYFCAVLLLRPSGGLLVSLPGMLPVLLGAWFFGPWAGLALAAGFQLAFGLLEGLLGLSELQAMAQPGRLLGLLACLGAGLAVGQLGLRIRRSRARPQAPPSLLDVRNDYNQFLTLLNDILHAAMETEEMSSMLKVLATRTGQLFKADDCYITFWDEKTSQTIPMVAYGTLSENYTSVHRFLPQERTLTEAVLLAGQALAIEDIKQTTLVSPGLAEEFPNQSALGLPLISGDRKLGAVILGFIHRHEFTSEEIDRASLASRQISLAVTKAILLQEAAQRVEELAGLQSVSQVFSLHGDPRQTCTLLSETLARLLGADICAIGLYEAAQQELRVQLPAFGLTDEQTGLMQLILGARKKGRRFLQPDLLWRTTRTRCRPNCCPWRSPGASGRCWPPPWTTRTSSGPGCCWWRKNRANSTRRTHTVSGSSPTRASSSSKTHACWRANANASNSSLRSRRLPPLPPRRTTSIT